MRKGMLLGALSVVVLMGLYGAAPVKYSITCTAISNVALSTSSETVIASDADRKRFCITNNDASIAIYVAFHATATSADPRVPPGGSICEEVSYGGAVYTGVVDAIAASGTPAISGMSCE